MSMPQVRTCFLFCAALVAGSLLFATQHALAQYTRGADCVQVFDFTCLKTRARATMVMPAREGGIIYNNSGGGIPAGYTEKVLRLNPGAISAEVYSLLAGYAQWPAYTCTNGVCSDGRTYGTAGCGGVFEKKLYQIVVDTRSCYANESGEVCTGSVTSSAATCAAPGTQIAYLVKDAEAATMAQRAITAAELAAFKVGADAISADAATINALCIAYGAVGAYSVTTGSFSGCSDNTLSQYIGGTWYRRNACTAGNTSVSTLTCAFSS